MKQPIQVWRFEDAPEEYRKLSTNGGDEDWLALVPAEYKDKWIPWMESNSSFGVCDVSEYDLPNGDVIRIGAHA